MDNIKAGIIGLGVGEQHILGYDSHPDSEVVALCDFSEKKIKECKEKYSHIKITENADEILEDPDIDVVSIASFDNYHYEQIMKAINNGKHIFVEKPLCLYEREAIGIRKALNNHPNIRISSNLIMRTYPRFQFVKKMIEDGKFGDIFFMEGDYNYGRIHKITEGWRGDIDFYSVIYGGGVHMVDLLLWLTDKHVDEVVSYGNRISTHQTKFKYNDFAVSLLKFSDGAIGKISSNFGCVFPHFHAVSIYGTKATFINDFEYGRLMISRDPNEKFERINVKYKSSNKGELIYRFVDFINGVSDAIVSVDDIFETMSICLAMEKSTKIGKPVKVNYI